MKTAQDLRPILPEQLCTGVSAQRVALHFSKGVDSYEAEAGFHRKLVRELEKQVLELSLKPQNILEIGSHTGLLSRQIRTIFPLARLYCVDIQAEGHQKNIRDALTTFVQANGEKLPFAPQTFDLVVSGATFQWFNGWLASLLNIVDLIKPGGILAFSQFLKPSLEPLRSEAEKIGRASSFLKMMEHAKVLEDLKNCFPEVQGQFFEQVNHYPNLHSILKHLRAMGVGASLNTENKWTRLQIKQWEEGIEAHRDSMGLPLRYGAGIYRIRRPLL